VATTPITEKAFAPYGQLLAAQPDGTRTTIAEATLDLSQGTPRFYVMELAHGRTTFTRITRHHQVTQVLAAVGGGAWRMAVARGDGPAAEAPALDDIVGFEIPGDVAVLLHRGTWHAGPFYDGPRMAFFNLELTDTNVVDHDTSRLDARFGVECCFSPGLSS
jgi:ureidoglycolate lyase